MIPRSLYLDKSGFEYDLAPIDFVAVSKKYKGASGYKPHKNWILPTGYVRPSGFTIPSGLIFQYIESIYKSLGESNTIEDSSTDLEQNAIGETGIYELGELLERMVQKSGQYNAWSTWIEKFQIDYRFLAISDLNAEAYLFPNVDDPWMFTEYIFEGKDVDRIVEPELYDPEDLHWKNAPTDTSIPYMRQIHPEGWVNKQNGDGYPTIYDGVKLYRTDVKVQCVKWGEHGNIPPKTLNMTAPRSWIDANLAAGVKRIVPVVTSQLGFAQYADSSSLPATVHEIYSFGKIILKRNSDNAIIEQSYPKLLRNEALRGTDQGNAKFIGAGFKVGELIHEGCEFWKDLKCDGTGDCSLKTTLTDKEVEKLKVDKEKCIIKDGQNTCPFWRQKDIPVEIGTWVTTAATDEEWARIYAGIPYGGTFRHAEQWKRHRDAANFVTLPLGAGGLFFGGAALGLVPLGDVKYEAPRSFADHSVRTKITYEIQNVSIEPKEVYSLRKNYGGENADKYTRVKRGTGIMALDAIGTSDVYGGVDTVYYGDIEQSSFHRWFNNIMHCQDCKYCNSIYGYSMNQGFDPYNRMVDAKGERSSQYCRYYVDYSVSEVGGGCPYNSVPKMAYEYQEIMDNSYTYILPLVTSYLPTDKGFPEKGSTGDSDIDVKSYNGHYILVADEDKTYKMGGADCSNMIGGKYVIAHFELNNDNTLKDTYFYIKMYFDNGTPSPNNPWLVKIEKEFYKTKAFCIHVENNTKFIGGNHPEYKDLTKRKPEVLEEIGGGGVLQGDYGVGDSTYWAKKESGYFIGYYPDKWGEWIIDGRGIGDYPPSDDQEKLKSWHSEDARAAIIPFCENGATPISGTPGSTFISPEKTLVARIIHANVFTNDTVAVLEAIKDDEYMDSEGMESYKAKPEYNENLIPTARTCPKCNTDDIYFNERYEGDKCPWCNNDLVMTNPPLKLPICKAIGKVNVYAMPGMTIKGDAYYWKNPTVITEAVTRQIQFKIAAKSASADSTLLPYAEGIAYHKPVEYVGEDNNTWNGMTKDEVSQWAMYNALIKEDMLPTTHFSEKFLEYKVNNQYIMPYVDDEKKGTLQMITINQLRKLRNRLQPIFAYYVGEITNTDYDLRKATNTLRRTISNTEKRTWTNKPGRMGIEILAATSIAGSNFNQYWLGDIFGTVVREYFPTSPEWWRKNNLVGGIGRSEGINAIHLDDSSSIGGAYGYTGNLQSKALVSLYGVLPLDKEILKAYAILNPASDPEIGDSPKFWSGVKRKYHYHPFWTGHETRTHPNDMEFVSQYGDMYVKGENISFQDHTYDEGDKYYKYHRKEYPVYTSGEMSDGINMQYSPSDGFGSVYNYSNEEFQEPLIYTSAIDWKFDAFTYLGWWDETNRYGHYDRYAHDDPWGILKGTSGNNWKFGEDIVQTKTENQIWKHYTFDEFSNLMKTHTAKCILSAESSESKVENNFKQYSQTAINEILPIYMQPTPGMFNIAGINNSNKYPAILNIAKKYEDPDWQHSGQLILQSEQLQFLAEANGASPVNDPIVTANYMNPPSNGNTSAGREQRVLDITTIVKDYYNKRVSRRFTAQCGMSIKELFEKEIPQSNNQCDGDDDKLDAKIWNYRYKKT